ncbi:MAG: hypothetical protein JNL79_28490 [Myxococcales bacterium]|nr:hypothetical protein [Myxococcales bacterium]
MPRNPVRRPSDSRLLVPCVGLLTLGLSRSASANPLSTFGWDADSAAVAGSNLAVGRSPGVVHANPALLDEIPSTFTFGLVSYTPRLDIQLMKRPAGADVPLSIYGSSLGNQSVQDRALPTAELPHRRSDTHLTNGDSRLVLGLVTSPYKAVKVGVLLTLPMSGGDAANVATRYDDERQGTFDNKLGFTRFGGWNRIAGVAFGASFAPWDWLSIGIGAQLSAQAQAKLQVYVPDAAVQDYAQSNLETNVGTTWRSVLGVRMRPKKWLSVGLVFRGESYFRIDAVSEVVLWNYHEADPDRTVPKRTQQSFPVVTEYQPQELGLGVAGLFDKVTVQASATLQRWSRYLDHHAQAPEAAALVPGRSIDASAYQFHDIVSFAGAITLRPVAALATTLGAAFLPSPVPAQVGRTTYVDSNLFAFTFGQRADIVVSSRKVWLSLALQLWQMQQRTTYKDPSQMVDEMPDDLRTLRTGEKMPEARGLQTNSPGYPGFVSQGTALTTTFSIGVEL